MNKGLLLLCVTAVWLVTFLCTTGTSTSVVAAEDDPMWWSDNPPVVQSYKVEYLDPTGKEVAPAKTATALADSTVLEFAPTIEGFQSDTPLLHTTIQQDKRMVLQFSYTPVQVASVPQATAVFSDRLHQGILLFCFLITVLTLLHYKRKSTGDQRIS